MSNNQNQNQKNMNALTAIGVASLFQGSAMNRSLDNLKATNEQILRIQQKTLGTQEGQLASLRNIESQMVAQTNALNAQMELLKLQHLKAVRQQQLKDAFFNLSNELSNLSNTEGIFEKLIKIISLENIARSFSLNASELDEIADKTYAQDVLQRLQSMKSESELALTNVERNGLVSVLEYHGLHEQHRVLTEEINGLNTNIRLDKSFLPSKPNWKVELGLCSIVSVILVLSTWRGAGFAFFLFLIWGISYYLRVRPTTSRMTIETRVRAQMLKVNSLCEQRAKIARDLNELRDACVRFDMTHPLITTLISGKGARLDYGTEFNERIAGWN
jgi:hypothetical protein